MPFDNVTAYLMPMGFWLFGIYNWNGQGKNTFAFANVSSPTKQPSAADANNIKRP